MGGFFNALWFWFPVLIYKALSAFFRTIWKFNLWVLQTICGVPLYYCRPEYRIPGIFLGTIGTLSLFNFVCYFLILSSDTGNILQRHGISIGEILLMGVIGFGFLALCRVLIRKGAI